jgi:hypothetical protein
MVAIERGGLSCRHLINILATLGIVNNAVEGISIISETKKGKYPVSRIAAIGMIVVSV